MRVALFVSCFNDTLFPGTGRAVVELLERLGVEVGFPEAQTCCGQMHGNSGYASHGDGLAERWRRVFADYDTVVSPSASCTAFLREKGVERVRAGVRAVHLAEILVCVIHEEQIVAGVPGAVAHLAEAARAGRPITLVSGPSATSDIELDRVEGVHGPRRLEVLVVAPAQRA